MKHRIAAGAIVMDGERILLVRHARPGEYDFLVFPGGGVLPGEDAAAAVQREVWEETGLVARPQHLVYVEETEMETMRECKMWFFCTRAASGTISVEAYEAQREHIVEAGFYSREELEGRVVFPPIIFTDEFWQDAANGFPEVKYLGLRERHY